MAVYGDCHAIVRSIDLAWGGSISLLVTGSVNVVVCARGILERCGLSEWLWMVSFGFARLCVP